MTKPIHREFWEGIIPHFTYTDNTCWCGARGFSCIKRWCSVARRKTSSWGLASGLALGVHILFTYFQWLWEGWYGKLKSIILWPNIFFEIQTLSTFYTHCWLISDLHLIDHCSCIYFICYISYIFTPRCHHHATLRHGQVIKQRSPFAADETKQADLCPETSGDSQQCDRLQFNRRISDNQRWFVN